MSKDTEKTTWLRMQSKPEYNEAISQAVLLWCAVHGDQSGSIDSVRDAYALSEICNEWSDRERERIRRPEK